MSTLGEHLFGWNTGLDQLLFHESAAEAGLSFPGRMGVAASLNFFFLGVSLLFLDARSEKWFRVSNTSVLAVIAITLLVFLYYFYGIEQSEAAARYFTIGLLLLLGVLIWLTALSLNRTDRERRRADLALRDNEERLSALLELLPVGIGLTDRQGKFLIRNSLWWAGDWSRARPATRAASWGNDQCGVRWPKPGVAVYSAPAAAARDGAARIADRCLSL